jgi:hypothetical protein
MQKLLEESLEGTGSRYLRSRSSADIARWKVATSCMKTCLVARSNSDETPVRVGAGGGILIKDGSKRRLSLVKEWILIKDGFRRRTSPDAEWV